MVAGEGLEGAERLMVSLRAMPGVALAELGAGLYQEANNIMSVAKAETPVDQGTLRASGLVEPPVVAGLGVEVTLGFGGAARAYAVIQHERSDFHHTVGKDHYLSDPMMAAAPGMEPRLAARLARRNLFPGLR